MGPRNSLHGWNQHWHAPRSLHPTHDWHTDELHFRHKYAIVLVVEGLQGEVADSERSVRRD